MSNIGWQERITEHRRYTCTLHATGPSDHSCTTQAGRLYHVETRIPDMGYTVTEGYWVCQLCLQDLLEYNCFEVTGPSWCVDFRGDFHDNDCSESEGTIKIGDTLAQYQAREAKQ